MNWYFGHWLTLFWQCPESGDRQSSCSQLQWEAGANKWFGILTKLTFWHWWRPLIFTSSWFLHFPHASTSTVYTDYNLWDILIPCMRVWVGWLWMGLGVGVTKCWSLPSRKSALVPVHILKLKFPQIWFFFCTKYQSRFLNVQHLSKFSNLLIYSFWWHS